MLVWYLINLVNLAFGTVVNMKLPDQPITEQWNNETFQVLKSNSDKKQPDINPKNILCWDNQLDVMVELDNRHLYAIKHRWAWRLDLQSNKSHGLLLSEGGQSTDLQSPLSQLWPNLPDDIELAFTMPHLAKASLENQTDATSGSTIFVKHPNYYLYRNHRLIRSSSVVHWEPSSFVDNRFVATLHRTNLVLVAKEGNIPDGIKSLAGGQVFAFDCAQFPEKIGTFEVLPEHFHHMEWLNLKQLIALRSEKDLHSSSEADRYLALFALGTSGHHYCLMQNPNRTTLGHCQASPISSAFRCPSMLLKLKETNWAQSLWQLTGFSLQRIILILTGALLGSLWINTLLLLDTVKQFNLYYSKDVLELHSRC